MIDAYNAAASWADVLMPHGWACLEADPDADGARWLHPTAHVEVLGDDQRRPIVLLLHLDGARRRPRPETQDGYSKFDALARFEHNGDWKAAARQLRNSEMSQNDHR